jgi:adenosine deaminase
MTLRDFIHKMPKVELHVHLQGAIQPPTLLKLARRNNIVLPVDNIEDIQKWYTFKDFPHFIEIYDLICECLCTPDDIELATCEFLIGQAEQNIRYTELTYTPSRGRMTFSEQLDAINRARAWAQDTLQVMMNIVIDIPRGAASREDSLLITDWAISGMDKGVVALGLGGAEIGNPPEKFVDAFNRAHIAGLSTVPHAGETVGPESIWSALNVVNARRIGHGVRCIEDPVLVNELRERQVPLEVCPTSNVCLGVFDSMDSHPVPHLIEAGLHVTINSDDPPMFNTTLTNEYIVIAETFSFNVEMIERLVLNGVQATLLDDDKKSQMEREFIISFGQLRTECLIQKKHYGSLNKRNTKEFIFSYEQQI